MANACGRPKTEAQHEWAERWLSSSRLSSYLDLFDGNIDCALELHEWNLMLGRVLMGDIAHFELALRNAYDRALTERFQGNEHWLFDANSPVTRPIMRNSKAKKMRDVNMVNRRAINDARGRAHDPANPDQVIAGLMLGFWAVFGNGFLDTLAARFRQSGKRTADASDFCLPEHQGLVHPLARAVELDESSMVDHPVDHRGGKLVVAQDRSPFAELDVDGEHHASLLVAC